MFLEGKEPAFRALVLNRHEEQGAEQLCPPRDIWSCLEGFLVVTQLGMATGKGGLNTEQCTGQLPQQGIIWPQVPTG